MRKGTIEKAEGIVLDARDYSRSSRIFTVYTREWGKIALLAKGYWRPRNRQFSYAEPGSFVEIVFYRNPAMDLYILAEMAETRRLSLPRSDISLVARLEMMCEVITRLTGDEEQDPKLYTVIKECLHPPQGDLSLTGTAVLRFIYAVLISQGYMSKRFACSSCGTADAAFMMRDAAENLICQGCSPNGTGGQTPLLLRETVVLINRFLTAIQKAHPWKPPKSALGTTAWQKASEQAKEFALDLVEHHSGTRLKTRQFLEKLKCV